MSKSRLQTYHLRLLFLVFFLLCNLPGQSLSASGAHDQYLKQINSLHQLWHFYKYTFIEDGRVISRDENNITTSEGQSYAMLRAVWANDHPTFQQVYQWTKKHLMVRGDHLFAWKWQHDKNSASDADTDIALALSLASEKFSMPQYQDDALVIIKDIWAKEVIKIDDKYYLTAGNWSPKEKFPVIHVGYLAPYAYELFAQVDHQHPWKALINSSYEILEWIYFTKGYALPPQIVFVNKKSGNFFIEKSEEGKFRQFSYDAFPIFWRIAVDYKWHARGNRRIRKAMLGFFQSEWGQNEKIFDRYTLEGEPRSNLEALPLYATLHSLALTEDGELAAQIYTSKLQRLWENALSGKDTPYYLHNWLWFGRALDAGMARNYLAFFDFLKPIDTVMFYRNFPWLLTLMSIILYMMLFLKHKFFHRIIKVAFLMCGLTICCRYLWWRLNTSLNFLETLGPFISISLWVAELYCLTTIVLLVVQVGLDPDRKKNALKDKNYTPSVDIYIPIYSESIDILRKTLIAACTLQYKNKNIYILDDSHRDAVHDLAIEYGASYIKGPRKHAKAGNLNNALAETSGDLIAVFDTDHIPVSVFLDETIPYFCDPKIGVVQTPHHFYNQDIFQKAFRLNNRVPNEQDMFNHGIQGGRNNWGGAFFVGSGAVFRRKALEAIGGFKLMSITEDIHSSQHLHAKGFRSVFVDKDLAVGLTAENYASYLLQRKRWMQGCLQIFFRNNPLFQKGMRLRLRFGYFASLYYFFFPVIRIIFWITPLYYLLFHLHPIFSDVSILLAYLIPNMICLPLLASGLLKRWPRMFWGVVYENAVCFPLFLSLFDLVLPRKLAFKVTPKGITSDKRKFDFSSSWLTLIVTAITFFAIVKGIFEFQYFGIEKDAYFFNLGWATYNLIFMLVSLLVAWERPQKRKQERLSLPVPFKLRANSVSISGKLADISLNGASFEPPPDVRIPQDAILELFDQNPLRISVKRIYCDKRMPGKKRCGLEFTALNSTIKHDLLRRTFASADTWEDGHAIQTRSNIMMGFYFFKGIIGCFLPTVTLKRSEIRHNRFQVTRVYLRGGSMPAILRNSSENGAKLIVFAKKINQDGEWKIHNGDGPLICVENIYINKIFPLIFQAGFKRCESR